MHALRLVKAQAPAYGLYRRKTRVILRNRKADIPLRFFHSVFQQGGEHPPPAKRRFCICVQNPFRMLLPRRAEKAPVLVPRSVTVQPAALRRLPDEKVGQGGAAFGKCDQILRDCHVCTCVHGRFR